MRKCFSKLGLLGFLYLNAALCVVIWLSALSGLDEYSPLLVCVPFVLVIVLAPYVGAKWLTFPQGWVTASRILPVIFVFAAVFAFRGSRNLTLLGRGATVTGISVTEVPFHPGGVAFEFTDGRGQASWQGIAEHESIIRRSVQELYVVPFVTQTWTPQQPVTVWAMHIGRIPPEVLSGEFRAGLLCDTHTTVYRQAELAKADAISRHKLQSHPHAVIVQMHNSVAQFKNTAVTLLIFSFGLMNVSWVIATWNCPPLQKREQAPAPAPAATEPTMTLPLTIAMKDCLRAYISRTRRLLALCFLGLCLFMCLVLGAIRAAQTETIEGSFMSAVHDGGVIVFVFVLIFSPLFLLNEWQSCKALRASTFLRTRGPLSVRRPSVCYGGSRLAIALADRLGCVTCDLVLADRELRIDERGANQVSGLAWGTVDHAPHIGFVFEVRDEDRLVYRHPLYQRAQDQ
jgi:hypothetical protein